MQLIRAIPLLAKAAGHHDRPWSLDEGAAPSHDDDVPDSLRPKQPDTALQTTGRVALYAGAGAGAGIGIGAMRNFRRIARDTTRKVKRAGIGDAIRRTDAFAGKIASKAKEQVVNAAASPRYAAAAGDPTLVARTIYATHLAAKARVARAAATLGAAATPRTSKQRLTAAALATPGVALRTTRFLLSMDKAAPAAALAQDWQEDKHPRDGHGEFASKGQASAHDTDHRARIEAAINGTTGHKPWDDAVGRLRARGRKPWIRVRPDGSVGVSTGDRMRTVAGPRAEPEAESTHQRPAPVVDLAERRTLARMTSLYSQAKRSEIPQGYTGSTAPELPQGSFIKQHFDIHKPQELTPDQHEAVRHGLVAIINAERQGALEAGTLPKKGGKLRGKILIPEGTPRSVIKKAYRHGAYRAMHEFGLGHYTYQMDPELKQQMQPLEHFVLYAQRRVKARMLGELKGQWKPYRREFGIPFKDNRTDPRTGEVRYRVRPLPPIIKAAGVFDDQNPDGSSALAKADPSATDPTDDQVSAAQAAGGAAGAALGTYAAVKGTKRGIASVSETIRRRTAAGVRLDARRLHNWHSGLTEGVMRDQAHIAGRLAAGHFRGVAGTAATLVGGVVGNYLGDVAARRAAGAKGEQDAYGPATAGLIGAIGGTILGHSLGHARFGKSADDGTTPDDGTGKDDSEHLLQPRQAIAGSIGGATAAMAAGHYLGPHLDRVARDAGRNAAIGFRRTAQQGGKVGRLPSMVREHEAGLVGHGTAFATRHGLGALVIGGSALLGDYAADKLARMATGKTGKENKYRHTSVLGATLGTAGLLLGHHYGANPTIWRSLRHAPFKRGLAGLAAGVTAGVGGEAVGNLLDEKTGTTDMVAGLNRRTLHRFGKA